jgi:hypothetical protein
LQVSALQVCHLLQLIISLSLAVVAALEMQAVTQQVVVALAVCVAQ